MKHYNFNKEIRRRQRRQAIADAITWIGCIILFMAIAFAMIYLGYKLSH